MIKVQCIKYPKEKCENLEVCKFTECDKCTHNQYKSAFSMGDEKDNFKVFVDKSFYARYLNKELTIADIDDYIDEYNKGKCDKALHEYLGLTWEQYSNFVETCTL